MSSKSHLDANNSKNKLIFLTKIQNLTKKLSLSHILLGFLLGFGIIIFSLGLFYFSKILNSNIQTEAVAVPEIVMNNTDARIGENFNLVANFSNIGNQVGYGPFIDLIFPVTGTDGDDGINFNNSTYLGQNVTSVSQTFPNTGLGTAGCSSLESPLEHPYALDNTNKKNCCLW